TRSKRDWSSDVCSSDLGVTVVSDGRAILAGLDRAGDEPLMLARALPAVPVLVGASRFLSGRLAEEQLGATVHLLDDGFQHVELRSEEHTSELQSRFDLV